MLTALHSNLPVSWALLNWTGREVVKESHRDGDPGLDSGKLPFLYIGVRYIMEGKCILEKERAWFLTQTISSLHIAHRFEGKVIRLKQEKV